MRSVYDVKVRLAKGDFTGADRLVRQLPSKTVVIEWDDAKVPAASRPEFVKARDQAIDEWKQVLSGVTFKLGKPGAIKIGFTETLPANPDSVGPAGAVFFESTDPNEAKVEGVLALKRTATKISTSGTDVHNEVAYAIGRYFGLERTMRTGTIMDRKDVPNNVANRILPVNRRMAEQNLATVDLLRTSLTKKQRVEATQPQARLDITKAVLAPQIQGRPAEFSISLTNTGTGKLNWALIPDCGCFTISPPSSVEPGATTLVRVGIDTTEYSSDFRKQLFFYSNDPDRNYLVIPVEFPISPRYEIIDAAPQSTYVIGDDGLRTKFYFWVNPAMPMKVQRAELEGITGAAQIKPMTGKVIRADGRTLEMLEGFGYEIDALTGTSIAPGRNLVNLVLTTDDPGFSVLRHGIYVQRGIAVQPMSLFLGDIERKAASYPLQVARPGKPFKILGVTSSHPAFSAVVEPSRTGDDYIVRVKFSGAIDFGDIRAELTIATDSKDQPQIVVPIRGAVH